MNFGFFPPSFKAFSCFLVFRPLLPCELISNFVIFVVRCLQMVFRQKPFLKKIVNIEREKNTEIRTSLLVWETFLFSKKVVQTAVWASKKKKQKEENKSEELLEIGNNSFRVDYTRKIFCHDKCFVTDPECFYHISYSRVVKLFYSLLRSPARIAFSGIRG